MSKKLRSGLFQSAGSASSNSSLGSSVKTANLAPAQGPLNLSSAEHARMQEEMQSLKTRMSQSERQVETLRLQMSDFIGSVDQRFERLSQALSRLEKSQHQQEVAFDKKIQKTREKIQNSHFEELKVESLIERQNLVLRNFENRLSALQKLIRDKEAVITKYFEALKRQMGR